jgi:hypothetical protein
MSDRRQDDTRLRPNQPGSGEAKQRTHKLRLGDREIVLPNSRLLRMGLGVAFILGGLVGFLPIVGFWMLPLGVLILSIDLPVARRWRRRFVVWWHRRREKLKREGDF